MLGVVQRHDFLADVRLERIVRVWQRRKSVLSTYMRTQPESTHQASCINQLGGTFRESRTLTAILEGRGVV